MFWLYIGIWWLVGLAGQGVGMNGDARHSRLLAGNRFVILGIGGQLLQLVQRVPAVQHPSEDRVLQI